MNDESNIPLLTDLIEKGTEFELSDLGLGQEFAARDTISELRADRAAKICMTPALEQEIRRILDQHMELAWHEIRLVIQRSATDESTDSES